MRPFGTFLAVGILALAAGCGDSSSGGGYTSPTGRTANSGGLVCKGQSCAAEDTYYSCVASKCEAQGKSCFGPSYASGTFAGACPALISCIMACPCDATGSACLTNCYAAIITDTACSACVTTITTCQSTSGCGAQAPTCTSDASTTKNDSSTTANDDSGTSTGTNCAALSACCPTMAPLASMTVQQCQDALVGALDSSCASTLASTRAAGLCP